ncbi:hypothetical protein BC835DRAFT_1410304 [Cytidiella melzeri]|nr:hypothetical protein BC835DRAFT_1410304 [Cytidiella melzeri]
MSLLANHIAVADELPDIPPTLLHQSFSDYLILASSVIGVYDSILTFRQEMRTVWQRQWTGVTCIYLLNRLMALLLSCSIIWFVDSDRTDLIHDLLTRFTQLHECSDAAQQALIWLYLVQHLVFTVFSALRLYAISGRRAWCFAAVVVMNFAPFVYCAWDAAPNCEYLVRVSLTYFNPANLSPVFGAIGGRYVIAGTIVLVSALIGLSYRTALIMRCAMIATDALVLIATWAQTIPVYMQARNLTSRMPVVTILLRDGTIYFIASLMINVMTLTIIIKYPDVPPVFSVTLTPILVSHFILNLRQAASSSSSPYTSGGALSEIRFSVDRLVGNMGEPLEHAANYEDEGDGGEGRADARVEDNGNVRDEEETSDIYLVQEDQATMEN